MSTDNPSTTTSPLLTNDHVIRLYDLASEAAREILAVYNDESLWQRQDKADSTPVTAADFRSSDVLVAGLPSVFECPVVSEEALPSFEDRKTWQTYWLVDPLDGTREFLHKTGEFVINIALMHDQQPVFGFLLQPVTGQSWWGGKQLGAFKGVPGDFTEMQSVEQTEPLVALGSRRSKWQGAWRERLTQAEYDFETESVGSALKFMRLAEGTADLYPRLGPTCEWDTAAPQAILEQTGGAIRQWNGEPLRYGKENVLNPHFVAVRDAALLNILTER